MRPILALVLACSAALAAAQLRTIPKEAIPGKLRHLQAMVVEIDGKPRQLAPGAQIRDTDNRLVLPASLVQKTVVGYTLDGAGSVHRVWILSPAERARLPK
ncbi:MAG TPA: hypothetical protein VFX94_11165, partial [Burkholderiales bacterium]|nr:hypothetical protein [Burkholderiales bacterium]